MSLEISPAETREGCPPQPRKVGGRPKRGEGGPPPQVAEVPSEDSEWVCAVVTR